MVTPGTNGAYWIRLHLAEFDDPRWLIIESFPEVADTVEIIYVKLLVLAGKCNAGGALVLPGGAPYAEDELAAVLRRQLTTVRVAIQMLEKYGFLDRTGNPPILSLPAWHEQDVDALALLADRRERDKNRKKEKRNENKQLGVSADMSTDIPRNVHAQNHHHNQTYYDDGVDPKKILKGVPPYQADKILTKIKAAMAAGHALPDCQQALQDAKTGATPGRPWYGLAHHYLQQLADTPPLPTAKPEIAERKLLINDNKELEAYTPPFGIDCDIDSFGSAEAGQFVARLN